MASSFKPNGYTTVSPYLVVSDPQHMIIFLEKVFGARELRRIAMPDGSIIHAELQIGDTVVMIGGAGPIWKPTPGHIHVYVENVDECYHRALEAGGISVQPPERKGDDPNRRGGVKDPVGNTWWISTQVV